MKTRSIRTSLLILAYLLAVLIYPAAAQDDARTALILEAEGPLTPAMANYIERGLSFAVQQNSTLVILQLNTPGGDVTLMSRIVEDLLNSQVPVVVYVAPSGAMAGSAGTLITLAGHQAAMAPETVIGAASPVGGQGEDIGDTMEAKLKEIYGATARALAERRGPEAVQVAEATVVSAKAVSATEALEIGLVDHIARSREELLEKLDGQVVTVNGEEVTLRTTGIVIENITLTFIERTLQLLTNPNIVFLLLTIGVQSILIELSSPGGWVAGFIGATSLLLAIYGLGILPVNWFGAIFLVMAFALFALDVKAPTHGALTAAGLAAFIAGALILFNSTRLPGFPAVSIPLVVGTGIVIALSFSVIIGFALRAMRTPIRLGSQTLVGKTGFVREPLNPTGTVYVAGELWTAELSGSDSYLLTGAQVEVVSVQGLRLKVRPYSGRTSAA